MFQNSQEASWQTSSEQSQEQLYIPCIQCDSNVSLSYSFCNSCGASMQNSLLRHSMKTQGLSTQNSYSNQHSAGNYIQPSDHHDAGMKQWNDIEGGETKAHAHKDDICKVCFKTCAPRQII